MMCQRVDECSGGYLAACVPSVLQWFDRIQDAEQGTAQPRWRYNRSMLRPWAVEATAHVAMIHSLLGTVQTAKQTGMIEQIQSWQEPQTGRFIDPLIKDADHVGVHTREHIWNHVTNVCHEALTLLGASPHYALPEKVFHTLNPTTLTDDILAMDWTNPWMVGEHWATMVMRYHTHQQMKPTETDPAIALAFEVVEKQIIDPTTGLPTQRGCEDVYVGCCGLFKLLFAYRHVQRPFPYPQKVIDTVLQLQQEHGHFRDDMCINWDLANIVRQMNAQLAGNHRLDEIVEMGNRLADYLLREHAQSDGAFSFFREHCLKTHNSIRISPPRPESDVVGTYMVVQCLRYADEWASA